MAKTKGKAKIAASNVPSQMEAVSDNDMIAESAPSESVEIKEAATTGVLDKSEVDNKEETRDGPDKSEEVGETEESEDGLDEVDNVEVSEDDLDKSEHGDKIEEPTDALDKLGEEDKEEEIKEDGKGESLATDVPEGEDVEERDVTGDKEEEPKEDGKQESMVTDVPEGEEVEERDLTGEAKDNGKGENTPNKQAKRIRRRKKKAATSAGNDVNKSSDTDKQGTSAAEKDSKMAEATVEDGKEESLATDFPEGEEIEPKDNGKGENAPKAKRMRRRKKKAAGGAANDAGKSSNADKQGTSAAEKDSKVADGMGLIFMCNAKTKNDCFHYKVFGLPASKKEIVAKVYKGMRLFLFDIDLKLMHGIYEAADSGGYNIEPKAFKSAFPSQVRFSVLKDCLPLPEEKFKAAIKGNYYARNKFNCELSPEQVTNLCKLFQSVGKTSRKKSSEEVIRAPEQTSCSRGRKTSHSERVRLDDSIPRDRKRSRHERVRLDDSIPRDRKRSRHERVRLDDSIARDRKRSRHERVRRDDNIPRGQDLYARREAYASPPPRLLALPPPSLPLVSYAYERPADYYYREPLEYRDPYSVYRESASREALHRESVSRLAVHREAFYREPLYEEAEAVSREAVYRRPIPYHDAIYPASSTPAAYGPPSTYYRY